MVGALLGDRKEGKDGERHRSGGIFGLDSFLCGGGWNQRKRRETEVRGRNNLRGARQVRGWVVRMGKNVFNGFKPSWKGGGGRGMEFMKAGQTKGNAKPSYAELKRLVVEKRDPMNQKKGFGRHPSGTAQRRWRSRKCRGGLFSGIGGFHLHRSKSKALKKIVGNWVELVA